METQQLDDWADQLYSAVVSDACDPAGLRGQTALPGLRPVAGQRRVLVGFARPVRAEPVDAIPATVCGGGGLRRLARAG